MTIEINGKVYEQIDLSTKQTARKPNSKMMSMLMGMSMIYAPYMGAIQRSSTSERPRNIDIIEEFKLIQDKKSKLSKSNRDWVEREFNKKFKLVE